MQDLNLLFYVALVLIAGLLCGRLVKQVKLPNVTGYIIAGLLLGPYVFRVIPPDIVGKLDLVSDVALGFIAFSIGSEFKISYFKRVGATPIVIAVLEALFAVIVVCAGLLAIGCDPSFAIVLSSIAAATAPASTIMVIKQYRAKGPVTDMLLSVVAIDDAAALMLFGIAVAVAKTIAGGALSAATLLQPVYEIGISLAVGAALGAVFCLPLRFFKKDSNRLIIIAGFVLLTVSVANLIGASALLTCMAMGGFFVNLSKDQISIMKICDRVTPPIFLIFFVVSGAELNLSVLPSIGIVGVLYVVLRVVGKFLGAYTGAKIMKAPKSVQKYIGPALVPQEGVAIGLSLVAQTVVPQYGEMIRAIILCSTLIYEITGPVITKATLIRAGEIPKQQKNA
ncbi:MAG: cation:proton antiporter [Clostridia bacterium]|nr:cation:proton antiporter [Clostridia bacterium]MBQ1375968.1 cation:proton antiporter [Clostridia bacterium]MBQ1436072.1 cation:proton antiporter [Clostridia bacterium]